MSNAGTTTPPHSGGSTPHTRWSRTLGIAIAAAVGVGVLVMAFLWPTITATAQNLPVAITGPSAQVAAATAALKKNANGVFDLTAVSDRRAAVNGITDRSYDGAIVLSASPEVLTASAASPIVTQMMTVVQQELQAQVTGQIAAAQAQADQQAAAAGHPGAAPQIPAVSVKLTDVVPLASTDSRGAGMMASAFPLTLGGMIGGIGISILVAGVWRRIAAVGLYAVAAGFVIVAVMQPWFGILQGSYLGNVAAVALALFATGAFIVGTASALGRPGIAVGAVITMLVGNPLSSATQPTQFLPGAWGAIGQWFVPGAASTLLRDLSYFPNASTVFPWLVLAGWAVLGTVLTAVGHFRSREVVHLDSWDEDAAPESARIPVSA